MSYIQNKKIDELNLKTGKYTLIGVSEMAMTFKDEIDIINFEYIEKYAQYSNLIQIQFKERRKRKVKGVFLSDSLMLLKGWDLDIKTEWEKPRDNNGFVSTLRLHGNALINLYIEDIDKTKELINNHIAFGEKGLLFYDDEKPLFLEDSKKLISQHAVIRRIINKIEVSQ